MEIGKSSAEFSLFYSLIENTEDAVFIIQALPGNKFYIRYVNSAYIERTGLSQEKLIDKELVEFIPANKVDVVRSNMQKCVETCTKFTIDEPIEVQGGNVFWRSQIFPEKNIYGNVEWLVGIAKDITGYIHASDKIEKQNSLLDDIGQIQTHILRKPVANIISLTDILLSQNIENHEERKEMYANLKASASELNNLINEAISKSRTNP